MKRLGAVLLLLFFSSLPVFARNDQRQGAVVRAEYGSGNYWTDVTERVRSFVHGNSLKFRVNDDTLGLDSQPGETSVLRLQVQDKRGRIREQIFQENESVKIRLSTGIGRRVDDGSGQLVIHRAEYGFAGQLADVTDLLRSQIRDNSLSLQVTNHTMGGDPAVGELKTLAVQYRYNGRNGREITREGNDLNLPGDSVNGRSR